MNYRDVLEDTFFALFNDFPYDVIYPQQQSEAKTSSILIQPYIVETSNIQTAKGAFTNKTGCRVSGFFDVLVFTKINEKLKSRDVINKISALLDLERKGDIVTKNTTVRDLGTTNDGYYSYSVSCAFIFDYNLIK